MSSLPTGCFQCFPWGSESLRAWDDSEIKFGTIYDGYGSDIRLTTIIHGIRYDINALNDLPQDFGLGVVYSFAPQHGRREVQEGPGLHKGWRWQR